MGTGAGILKSPLFKKLFGRRYQLLALDVRSDGILTAGFQGDAASPRLTHFRKFPFPGSPPRDGKSLGDLLKEPVKAAGGHRAPATTLLYRPSINLILTEAPEVPREEWASALRWRVRDLLDFPPDQAVVDAVPAPLPVPGEGPQAFVAGARRDTVRERVTALDEAGLDPRFVDIPDMAQRNLSALLPESPSGTCLLVLDDKSPLISIIRGRELCFSRQVGMEIGQEIAEVARELGAEREEARRHLARTGLAGSGEQAPDPQSEAGITGGLELEEGGAGASGPGSAPTALTDFADRLALEIQRSLDYYDSRFRQAAIQKVYLTGEGARIRGLEAYLESALGMDFEYFHPLDHLEADPGVARQREDVDSPIHEGALVIGAGLRMMDPGQV